jgi:hypothetical protein
VRELEAAQVDDPKPDDEPAQREIAECDAKLRQHRVALEAGADPADKAEVYGQLALTLTCKFALNDLGDER